MCVQIVYWLNENNCLARNGVTASINDNREGGWPGFAS